MEMALESLHESLEFMLDMVDTLWLLLDMRMLMDTMFLLDIKLLDKLDRRALPLKRLTMRSLTLGPRRGQGLKLAKLPRRATPLKALTSTC